MKIPERVQWALVVLDAGADDVILEIGGGPGVAAALVCARLTGEGRFLGIDRSAFAVAKATERNAEHVANGRAEFRQISLAEFAPGSERFDKIFAINVNVFWTNPSGPDAGVIRELLRPGGVLHLFYEGPTGSGKPAQVAETVMKALTSNGFTASTADSSASILCITGRAY